jgi:hypothetical protein
VKVCLAWLIVSTKINSINLPAISQTPQTRTNVLGNIWQWKDSVESEIKLTTLISSIILKVFFIIRPVICINNLSKKELSTLIKTNEFKFIQTSLLTVLIFIPRFFGLKLWERCKMIVSCWSSLKLFAFGGESSWRNEMDSFGKWKWEKLECF